RDPAGARSGPGARSDRPHGHRQARRRGGSIYRRRRQEAGRTGPQGAPGTTPLGRRGAAGPAAPPGRAHQGSQGRRLPPRGPRPRPGRFRAATGGRPRRPAEDGLRDLPALARGADAVTAPASPPSRLLAKSLPRDAPPGASHTLPGHLRDVYDAARRVLDATLGDQLRAFGLESEAEQARRAVLLAAATHDLGKANDHFQG